MKCFYVLVGLMMIAAGSAMAQGQVQVIENVLFSSNSVEDPVRSLTFGFGAEYTDSVDFANGEQILPPFFPPEGLFAYFAIKDKRGGEDFGTKDVRGIPDSVKGGTIDHFSQEWLIRLKRGVGQELSIAFQFPLLRGLDSVNFQAVQAGANFNHTFTTRGTVKIPNNLITSLKMTAYYNYDRALSVPLAPREEGPAGVQLYPNPVRSGRSVTLAATIPSGSHVEVSNVYGSVVESRSLGDGDENPQITLPALPAGAYMVRVLDRGERVIGQGRLMITE